MRCHWSSASSFLLLILLFFEPLSAQRGEFSLEQVMSAGFPSEMTAAPVGGAVAWVINERGVRNIWIARAPDYRGRQLTRYKNDDGQTISQLAWTPDASALVFVRGDGGRGCQAGLRFVTHGSDQYVEIARSSDPRRR